MTFPSQPIANDFRDDSGNISMTYYTALSAWKEVCLALVDDPSTGLRMALTDLRAKAKAFASMVEDRHPDCLGDEEIARFRQGL